MPRRHVDANFEGHEPRRRKSVGAPPVVTMTAEQYQQVQDGIVALDQRAALISSMIAQQGIAPTQTGVIAGPGAVWHPELMKVNDNKPPLGTMLGVPGIPIFNGVINDPAEYNTDFYWRDGIAKYDEMYRSDAQTHQVVQVMGRPIRRAKWDIQAVSDAAIDQEIASFVKSSLFDDMTMTTSDGEEIIQTWDDILRHILTMIPYGFSVMEYVWRRDKDGWTKWGCWSPMAARTIWRWWTGGAGELLGIQQYAYKDGLFQLIEIPAKKIIRFTFDQQANNYDGVSALRAAYPHWYYKTQLYAIEAVGHERTALPMPVITLPASASAADYDKARIIGENLRANEKMHVTLPEGWRIEYLQGHADSEKIHTTIEHHDRMIARSVGAMFLNLGGERGAFNLDKSQTATFQQAIQAEADYIAERITSSAIRKLVRANYDGVKVFPKLICSKISTQDLDGLTKMVQSLAGFVNPDPTLEDWLREEMGLPAAAPVTDPYTINSDNPSAGDSGGDQGDQANAGGKGGSGGASDQQDQQQGDSGGDAAAASETSDTLTWLMNETNDAVESAIDHFLLSEMTDTTSEGDVQLRGGYFNPFGGVRGARPTGGLGGLHADGRETLRGKNGEYAGTTKGNGEEKIPLAARRVGRPRGAKPSERTLRRERAAARARGEDAPLGRPGRPKAAPKPPTLGRPRRIADGEPMSRQTRLNRQNEARARGEDVPYGRPGRPKAAPKEAVARPEGFQITPRTVGPVVRRGPVRQSQGEAILSSVRVHSPVANGSDLLDATHLNAAGEPTLKFHYARRAVARTEEQLRNNQSERIVAVTAQGGVHDLGLATGPNMRKLLTLEQTNPATFNEIRGGALIFNHPLGGAPKAKSELLVASALGMRQLRVVTPFYRHSVSLDSGKPLTVERYRHIQQIHADMREPVTQVLENAVRLGAVNPARAIRQSGHAIWTAIQHLARIQYTRAAWDETSAMMRETEGDESVKLGFFGSFAPRIGSRPTGGLGGHEDLTIYGPHHQFAGRRPGEHNTNIHEHLAARRAEVAGGGAAERSPNETATARRGSPEHQRGMLRAEQLAHNPRLSNAVIYGKPAMEAAPLPLRAFDRAAIGKMIESGRAQGYNHAEGVKRLTAMLNDAKAAGSFEAAKNWYDEAHNISVHMRDMFRNANGQHHFSLEQVTGAIAATSPRNYWTKHTTNSTVHEVRANNGVGNNNIWDAANALRATHVNQRVRITEERIQDFVGRDKKTGLPNGKGLTDTQVAEARGYIGTHHINDLPVHIAALSPEMRAYSTRENIEKALQIARLPAGRQRAEDVGQILSGLKVNSFYNNIMFPGVRDGSVTIDTHMMNGLWHYRSGMKFGEAKDLKVTDKQAAWGGKQGYPLLAHALRTVAPRFGLTPEQTQAIAWVHWRHVAGYDNEGPEMNFWGPWKIFRNAVAENPNGIFAGLRQEFLPALSEEGDDAWRL